MLTGFFVCLPGLLYDFVTLQPYKKSTEKQFIYSSPDGGDILAKSRRASKIKARAGQDDFWNAVELLQKKNPDCSRFFDLFETIISVFSLP